MSNDTNKNEALVIKEENNQEFSLKLLFGPMSGCELHLPANDYLLVIDSGASLQNKAGETISVEDHALHYALNTLYIPCEIPSPNIVLRLSNPQMLANSYEYPAEIHTAEGVVESQIGENQVYTWQHIHIAVKDREHQWSEQVVNFNKVASVNEKRLMNGKENRWGLVIKNRITKIILACFFSCIVVYIIALSVKGYRKNESTEPLPALERLLSGSPGVLKVFKGQRLDKIYVLAEQLPEMEWAMEALHKLELKSDVEPILLYRHQRELVRQLGRDGYPVLQIDYREPQHPLVALYHRLTPEEERQFTRLMLAKIPFARDIKTTIRTKDQVLQEARQGLARLCIRYREVKTETGYALIINDKLSDNKLAALSNFIKGFDKNWGGNIVRFSINLDESWLQNKSYVDKSGGYVFLNPKHWYFPLSAK
ncbi:PrgH/EprH family type III secretion apparatus protein [Pantoea ananatis]|uniref:PrgH/EprH family type III secretion apparatus protein n=1 Tax=Pantoea ananas TaxID=553 RepID=UPI0024AD9BA8|nr:PrgH/EprH family type III secretion apparatus protein [Pantoea ananatis]MDI6539595.1 PrgH/EprH family type III secretion apparatus protein [Pantoea ananatis]